jgi:two-component system cell cycle sensor histidine kinase/response regulator CckA
LLKMILDDQGYTTQTVGNGSEAFAIGKEELKTFDGVITDIIMPHMNGTQVSERLRKIKPTLKTLFISGYTAEISHIGDLGKGQGFLEKPFNSKELLTKLRLLFSVR